MVVMQKARAASYTSWSPRANPQRTAATTVLLRRSQLEMQLEMVRLLRTRAIEDRRYRVPTQVIVHYKRWIDWILY